MNAAPLFTLVLMLSASNSLAHGYRAGPLEITHPAIMVPTPQSDCSCAHVKIVNHGSQPEYFLGAVISAANRTHLIAFPANGHGLATPMRVEILSGQTLDLSHQHWCLFMSGITTPLEADFGAVAGQLLFERQGAVDIEFMIDAAHH